MIAWIFIVLLVFYLVRKFFQQRAYENTILKHGCSPPPQYQHKDPILGIDLFLSTVRSISAGNSFIHSQSLFGKYGKTFETNSFGKRVLLTMDSENIHAILVTLQRKFLVEELRIRATENFLGRGVFNTDGPSWEHSRALLRPIFARAQISNLGHLEARVDALIGLIPRDGSTVDLLPLLKRLFLDTSTEFIFGESVNTLVPGTSSFDAQNFLGAFDTALKGIGIRIVLGRLAFLQGIDTHWKKACQVVHSFIDRNIDVAIQRRNRNSQDSTKRSFVLLDELVKETQDRLYLRSQLLNIFLPARDSTAIGIANVFFLIARHPLVWDKLRAEVLNNDAPVNFETLKSMKYVRHVVNESLRLIAPSGRNLRLATEDCILPHGGGADGSQPIFVQKGTEVMFVFRSMHYDEDLWGEDADDFRPERWERSDSIPQHGYVPFSAGGRVCPAQQMVLTECAYILVRLVREFEKIENRDPEESFIEQHKLQMESRNGVKVAFTVAT
ncbi:cytochrome P450 alkane hydroxylase-like protein [Mollisia scopiformis]|uniref:Cytochrome P450 alkane hydroxylase-like protein n=1 Tax=Mollisia scopiformis TaxID=149040 RepID=A0A132B672_MOLSC|nr:cytochrome P450 alkane hydroxylase-like protein [Mollisia scopiformis]KUJ07753.1 cytochrome P450 alkane hydroxylase-like protein [Mollisia scopiformis]